MTHDPATWHYTYDNIITLTGWMAENGYPVSEVARAVEKPWNYEAEYLAAELEMDDADLGILRTEIDEEGDDEVEHLRQMHREMKAKA